MPGLEKTKALIGDFAAALGLETLPPDDDGGYQVTVGDDTDVMLYGGDDETVLVVAPIAPLPRNPEYGTVMYLLRNNLFDSSIMPFQVAADDEGGLVLWARLAIADLTGDSLASIVKGLAEEVEEMRGVLDEEA
ncbi:MAG TPA: type III secretion system chaperone [Acetobacteraceae bacterium]